MEGAGGIAATGSDYSRAHAAACHAGYDRNGGGCGLRARTRSPLRGHRTGRTGYPRHKFSHWERMVMMHLSLLIILLIFGGAILAGVLGALVGLGGGILIVPLLTLAFGLPIQYAIGVSIIAVIATSSGAAAAYVRDHLTNIRLGMFLELGTTAGAITGAFLAGILPPHLLFLIFGVVLTISVVPLVFKLSAELPARVRNDH